MDIAEIKEYLIENPDYIGDVLEKLGFVKIREYTNEYRCAKDEYSDPTSIVLKKHNLSFTYRSSSKEIKGDIFTLIQEFENVNFTESIKKICKILGIKHNYKKKEDTYVPFGGYYKKFLNQYDNDYFVEIETYPEEVLESYLDMPNEMFVRDGISLLTQKEFNIRYDVLSDRIVIPWRNTQNEICGCIGRLNMAAEECERLGIPKYYPLISFPKSQVLYGFSENYKYLIDNTVWITESEKSVLQAKSIGISNVIAIGSNNLSTQQTKYIKSLTPKNIIIAYDEGVCRDHIHSELEKIKPVSGFYKYKTGYVHDKNNTFLKKGEKQSPFDLGKGIKEIAKQCIVWN